MMPPAFTERKSCIKPVIMLFNGMFIFGGLVSLGIGLWSLFDPGELDIFLGRYKFVYPSAMMVASGGLVLVVSFCGCFGVLKEHHCVIRTYIIFLLIIAVLQLVAGGLCFSFKLTVKHELLNHTSVIIRERYGSGDRDIDYTVDALQERLQCCGGTGKSDYKTSNWIKGANATEKYVPESCCSDPSQCTVYTKSELVYKTGCYGSLEYYVKNHFLTLGVVGVGIGGFQFFGIFFSLYLHCVIEPRIGRTR